MATRQQVVDIAMGELGYHSGLGYDEPCKYTAEFLGPAYGDRDEGGTESAPWYPAYCDIFVSWCYRMAGIPLPFMGGMIAEGQQYCPSSWAYAQAHGAARGRQEDAQPGDQVIFNWDGNWAPLGGKSHTEVVIRNEGGVLYTVGGNSGPGGGVNQHAWQLPNSLIEGVIDTSELVTFSSSPTPNPTPEGGDPVATNLAKMPVVDPGRDRGHPTTVGIICDVLKRANPKVDVSTPRMRTWAVMQWQAVLFNDWKFTGGPNDKRITGVCDMETLTAIMVAAAGTDRRK